MTTPQDDRWPDRLDEIEAKILQLKPALKRAGDMYLAAQLVTTATPFTLSDRVKYLQTCMDEYNNEIIKMIPENGRS